MAERAYWSDDRRYGAQIVDELISKMIRLCAQAAGQETGGILVGQYTAALDCAVIRAVSRAPSDSTRGRMWFDRGVRVEHLWARDRQYYLGEWHFHPQGAPLPSLTDIRQMEQIAASVNYRCPEPILVIIGGDPPHSWGLRVFAFPQGVPYQELKPVGMALECRRQRTAE
jgi:integrative and conjugative element protein (TIGR02256 family)